jgi:hypothetical protein
MYKPCHLMGLELGISVLSGALRGEPTEQPQGWRGDVVAVAKRELTVWGKLAPAEHSLAHGALSVALRPHPCRCRRRASAPGAGACVIFRAASRAGARTRRRREVLAPSAAPICALAVASETACSWRPANLSIRSM